MWQFHGSSAGAVNFLGEDFLVAALPRALWWLQRVEADQQSVLQDLEDCLELEGWIDVGLKAVLGLGLGLEH